MMRRPGWQACPFLSGLATGATWSSHGDRRCSGPRWAPANPQPLIPQKWTVLVGPPDGKRLAFAESRQGGADIWTVPVEADAGGLKAGKAEVFFQSPASEVFPAFSPDGRWIAYRTLESGTSEIEVRSFPDKGGKWLISTSGGAVPVWSPNGRERFIGPDQRSWWSPTAQQATCSLRKSRDFGPKSVWRLIVGGI